MYGQDGPYGVYDGDDFESAAEQRMLKDALSAFSASQLRLVGVLPIDRATRSVCLLRSGSILVTPTFGATGTMVAAAYLLKLTGLDPDRLDVPTRRAVPWGLIRIELVVATWEGLRPRAPEVCRWMPLADAVAAAANPTVVALLRVASKWIEHEAS